MTIQAGQPLPAPAGKVLSPDDVAGELRSGMTIGIGGWGSRRKPMALVRAILRSSLTDLVIVSYGGPDVGLLVAGGHVRRVVTGFVSLDTIPLEPHFRLAKQALNGIDPVDVKRSYRYEQGFTFELNLAGAGDRARQAFVDSKRADGKQA